MRYRAPVGANNCYSGGFYLLVFTRNLPLNEFKYFMDFWTYMWSWINNFFLFNAEWKWKSSCFVLRIVCPICSKVAYQSAVVCFKGGWTSMYGSLLSYPSILRSRPWGQLKSPHPPSPRGSPTQMPSAPSTRNLLSKYPQAGWHNLLPRRDEDQQNLFEDVS